MGQPAPFATARELVRLRLRRAASVAAVRWANASIGGGFAGVVDGAVGAFILISVPGSVACYAIEPELAVIGGCCGAAGRDGNGAVHSVADSYERPVKTSVLLCRDALTSALAG